jgi:hypothetical protein
VLQNYKSCEGATLENFEKYKNYLSKKKGGKDLIEFAKEEEEKDKDKEKKETKQIYFGIL